MTKRLLCLLSLTGILITPVPVVAQSEGNMTAVDAIQCWRRVSRNAVHVGERFTMTTTCRVVDTGMARALANQTVLEPATLDVGPFEVLDGQRHDDIRTGPYRFFQYRYTLRIISESDFGEDIEIPALDITYRVERRLGDDPALVGRELTYILPPEPIRVLSLVPESIVDIRELAPATFDEVQARVFKANLLTLLAAMFGVMAVGFVVVGAVRIVRDRRDEAARIDTRLSLPLVVHRALSELTRVQQTTAAEDWNVDHTSRVLTALRIGGSVALTGSVLQTPIQPGTPTRDGQLRIRHGWLRPKTTVISSGLTATALTQRVRPDRSSRRGVVDNELLDDLGHAISVFTSARYGRNGSLPTDALTRELDTGITRLKRLRWRSAVPVCYLSDTWEAATTWWTTLWTR